MTSPAVSIDAITASVQPDGLPPAARRLAMASLSIGVGMASLDTAIANTALPAMAAQLNASPAASVWIINAYQLAMVATLLPFAALGEVVGYRRTALCGLGIFTVASIGCALAWSLPALIGARLLQGVGAAAIMGVNTALLRAIYPKNLQGRGFGANALVVAIAFAIGPTTASLILAVSSWPYLFAINIPMGVAALILGRRVLPVTLRSNRQVDLVTALYNIGAFALLVLLFGDAAHQVSALRLAVELAGTTLFFGLLLRRQSHYDAPMLPTDLLARPLFSLSVLTSVATFSAQALAFVALPFYFESTLGRSAIETGFLMTPWPVLVAVMAPIAGRLSDHYSPGVLGGIGLCILAVGLALMVLLPHRPAVWDISWRMGVCGIGFGFFQAPNLKAFMSSAPAARAGGASGMVATSRLLGQAIGAAIVAYCFTLMPTRGAVAALTIAAVFAGVAGIASFARLAVKNEC